MKSCMKFRGDVIAKSVQQQAAGLTVPGIGVRRVAGHDVLHFPALSKPFCSQVAGIEQEWRMSLHDIQ
jgi:hypothetical protein